MTHTYSITGMTCAGCQHKVTQLLSALPGVDQVDIDLEKGAATVRMQRPIPETELRAALKDYPKYQLVGETTDTASALPAAGAAGSSEEQPPRSWWATYKPVLLIFFYLGVLTSLSEAIGGSWSFMRWMNHFMAGFFLIFSFFKFLDLRAFADSYRMYDLLAARWPAWGLLYPFAEAALGLLYWTNWAPTLTNSLTLLIMGMSFAGVLRSVLQKRKIRCACLGAVFNLPMSTITLVEDGLMLAMSAVSLLLAGRM